MPEASSIYIQLIKSTLSGKIFDDSYFDSLDFEAGRTSASETDGPQNYTNIELKDSVRRVVNKFKDGIYARNDRPFSLDTPLNEIIGDDDDTKVEKLVSIICRIFECEMSLFDEQKTHFERQQLMSIINEHKGQLGILFQHFQIEALLVANFSSYLDFIKYKSNLSYLEEINDNTQIPTYFEPFTELLKIDQYLDPKKMVGKDERNAMKQKIEKFYNDFPSDFIKIPDASDQSIDYSKVKYIDMYIYFGYVKNYKHSNTNNSYQAYSELKEKYDSFYKKNHNGGSFPRIQQRIYNTNKIYFINNLLSTLADAFSTCDSNLPKSKREIQKIQDLLMDLMNDQKDHWTYFTYYKIARLFTGIAKFYLHLSGKERNLENKIIFLQEAKTAFEKIKSYSKDALRKYNEPGGSLLRFYVDYGIITDKSNVFSLSGFCRSHGGDFNARIFGLELDSNELNLMIQNLENEQRIDNSIQKSEKNASRNNIEILSIFAALVMFVSGNIQIYQYVGSLKMAAIFTLLFLFCLLVFVIVLRWKPKDSIAPLIGILSVSIGLLLYIYFGEDYDMYNDKYIDHFKEEIIGELKSTNNLVPAIKNQLNK